MAGSTGEGGHGRLLESAASRFSEELSVSCRLALRFILSASAGCGEADGPGPEDVVKAAAASGPQRSATETQSREIASYDFGTVVAGSTLTHTFLLANETDAGLRFTGSETSCSCTVPTVSPSSVPPGETAAVSVAWRTGAADYSGSKSLAVTFRPASGGAAIQFPLLLTANVRRALSVDAERIDFGLIAPAAPATQTLTVRNFGDVEWPGPPRVSTAATWLTARHVPAGSGGAATAAGTVNSVVGDEEADPAPSDAARQTFVFELTATLSADRDPRPATVRVSTAGATRSVRVLARRDTVVRVLPAQLYFGPLKVGRGGHAAATLRLARGLSFDPSALTVAPHRLPGDLSVTAEEDRPGF